jgi:hypothetical protein
VPLEIRELIREMSIANPLGQTSVANGMDRPCSRPQRHAESVGGF